MADVTELSADEADDEGAFPFIDLDPPQLPEEVWERSLQVAVDPTVEGNNDLVPDTEMEYVYDESGALGTGSESSDVHPAHEASDSPDPLDQPGPTSIWDESQDAPSDATDYGGDSW